MSAIVVARCGAAGQPLAVTSTKHTIVQVVQQKWEGTARNHQKDLILMSKHQEVYRWHTEVSTPARNRPETRKF